MKKGWDRYATDKGIIKKGYIKKYRNGSQSRKTGQASGSDSVFSSAESKEKEVSVVYEYFKAIKESAPGSLGNNKTVTFRRFSPLGSAPVSDAYWAPTQSPTSSTSPDCLECTPDTTDHPKPQKSDSRQRAKRSRKGNTSP